MENEKNISNDGMLNLVSEETKQKMINEVLERQKKLEAENLALRSQLLIQEKAVKLFVTEGIDMRDLPPLSLIAPRFNMKVEELNTLMHDNRPELFKLTFKKFIDFDLASQRFMKDKQLDLDGNAFNDTFKEMRDLCEKYRGGNFSAFDVTEFKDLCSRYPTAFQSYIDYKKVVADHSNAAEALAYINIYMRIEDLQENAAQRMTKDYVKRNEEIEAKKAADIAAEEEAKNPKPNPEIEQIKFEIKEQKTMLEKIAGNIDNLIGKKEDEKKEEEEVIESANEEEPKKRGKR